MEKKNEISQTKKVRIELCSGSQFVDQATYLKNFICLNIPSLEDSLEIDKFVDISLKARLFEVLRVIFLIIIVVVMVFGFYKPDMTSSIYHMVLFIRKYRLIIQMGAVLGNASLQYFTNDKAFEIFINGKLVYSKLSTGREPTEQEILDIFKKDE